MIIKFFRLSLAAVVFAASLPLSAQSDPEAAMAALDSVVRKYSHYKNVLDPYVEKIYKKFDNNSEVITGIAKAYYSFSRPEGQMYYTFVTRDSANAYKYINLAIANDRSYVPAYIHGGDIQLTMGNRDAALDWYRRAIAADKFVPDGYLSYLDVALDADSSAAVSTMSSIRDCLPAYPVELAVARAYERRSDVRRAIGFYDKADRDSMDVDDLVSYAIYHYLLGNFDSSLGVALYGHGRFPGNAALDRLAFWNYTDLKKYDEALEFAGRLFHDADTADIQSKDYLYYGYAYLGKQRYADAVDMFGKVASFDDATEKDKVTAMQKIVKAYRELGDYDKAEVACLAYIDKRQKDSLLSAYDLNLLAEIYIEKGDTLSGEGRAEAWRRADSVLTVMSERFPANADYALYRQLTLANGQDPESAKGLGVPYAQRLIAVVEAMPDRTSLADERMKAACHYLGYYYTFVAKQRARGRVYWEMVLEIDPDNNAARTVLGLK